MSIVMERIPGIILRREIPAPLGLAPSDVGLLNQNLVKAL
jgi:hypothetical protein